jgi:hypothetical protein
VNILVVISKSLLIDTGHSLNIDLVLKSDVRTRPCGSCTYAFDLDGFLPVDFSGQFCVPSVYTELFPVFTPGGTGCYNRLLLQSLMILCKTNQEAYCVMFRCFVLNDLSNEVVERY